MKKFYGTFGVEMRAYGQKLVQFCKHTHTHTRVSFSSIDIVTRLLAHLVQRPFSQWRMSKDVENTYSEIENRKLFSATFQLPNLVGYGLGLRFCVVLTLTLT